MDTLHCLNDDVLVEVLDTAIMSTTYEEKLFLDFHRGSWVPLIEMRPRCFYQALRYLVKSAELDSVCDDDDKTSDLRCRFNFQMPHNMNLLVTTRGPSKYGGDCTDFECALFVQRCRVAAVRLDTKSQQHQLVVNEHVFSRRMTYFHVQLFAGCMAALQGFDLASAKQHYKNKYDKNVPTQPWAGVIANDAQFLTTIPKCVHNGLVDGSITIPSHSDMVCKAFNLGHCAVIKSVSYSA